MSHRVLVGGLAFLAVLSRGSLLLSDGCMMPIQVGESTAMAASPKQEAIIITDGETVQVILRTHFRSGPRELAWIVPVPGKPENIAEADDLNFQKLEEITAPKFLVHPERRFNCGCATLADRAVEPPLAGSVVVETAGNAGIFEYAALSAGRADQLVKWLNDHQYFIPAGAEKVFERYTSTGWHWLAMRVRPAFLAVSGLGLRLTGRRMCRRIGMAVVIIAGGLCLAIL